MIRTFSKASCVEANVGGPCTCAGIPQPIDIALSITQLPLIAMVKRQDSIPPFYCSFRISAFVLWPSQKQANGASVLARAWRIKNKSHVIPNAFLSALLYSIKDPG